MICKFAVQLFETIITTWFIVGLRASSRLVFRSKNESLRVFWDFFCCIYLIRKVGEKAPWQGFWAHQLSRFRPHKIKVQDPQRQAESGATRHCAGREAILCTDGCCAAIGDCAGEVPRCNEGICPLVKSAYRCGKTLYQQGPRVVPHTHGWGGVVPRTSSITTNQYQNLNSSSMFMAML